jgi:hypothetical protein
LHVPEQHLSVGPQALPEVLHVVLSGVQVPPPMPSGAQRPPQQSVSAPHAPLSLTHCLLAHVPPVHENVQHSLPVAHVAPGALHWVTGAAHFFDVASQFAVQQSVLPVQSWPTSLHVAASARPPSVMASTNDPSRGAPPSLPGVPVSLPGWVFPSADPVSSPESAKSSAVSLPHPVKSMLAPRAPTTMAMAATGSLRMTPPRSLQRSRIACALATARFARAHFGRMPWVVCADNSSVHGDRQLWLEVPKK